MTKNCRFCGEEFELVDRRGPTPEYCTPACKARAVKARRRNGVPIDPVRQRAGVASAHKRWQDDVHVEVCDCATCGESFNRYGRSNQRYCSLRCRGRAARQRWLDKQTDR